MAGGRMVSSQQAGRQPVTPAGNVEIAPAQPGQQGDTSRTTRIMARAAGGH